MMKKLQYHQAMNDTHGPRFGTLFCHFFLKKFRFSLEGLVKVRYLVLARTTGDFAQPCPAGQSSNYRVAGIHASGHSEVWR